MGHGCGSYASARAIGLRLKGTIFWQVRQALERLH
jgi:hypothetical protein